MIQINLLGTERQKVKTPVFNATRHLTLMCTLTLAATAAGVGWWYWALMQESSRLDTEIAEAQREAERLRGVLAEVQQFEERRAQLQERVGLIEDLRGGQSVPVQLLDHVSRSLPEMLWLTSFQQEGQTVTIEGRSTTLIALSDFVGNLGAITLLQKPIEIIDSQVEEADKKDGPGAAEVISFTVRAQLVPSGKPKTPATPAKGRGASSGPAASGRGGKTGA